MTYEELLALIRDQKGSLTAEQWLTISASGLRELADALKNAQTGREVASQPWPKKIGRPFGAKDKRPRKRRSKTAGHGHAPKD